MQNWIYISAERRQLDLLSPLIREASSVQFCLHFQYIVSNITGFSKFSAFMFFIHVFLRSFTLRINIQHAVLLTPILFCRYLQTWWCSFISSIDTKRWENWSFFNCVTTHWALRTFGKSKLPFRLCWICWRTPFFWKKNTESKLIHATVNFNLNTALRITYLWGISMQL